MNSRTPLAALLAGVGALALASAAVAQCSTTSVLTQPDSNGSFGIEVAVDADRMIAAARPRDDLQRRLELSAGRARVLLHVSRTTSGGPRGELPPIVEEGSRYFGSAVALSYPWAAVVRGRCSAGPRLFLSSTPATSGGSARTWTSPSNGRRVRVRVDMNEDASILVISSPDCFHAGWFGEESAENFGAWRVYLRSGQTWTPADYSGSPPVHEIYDDQRWGEDVACIE